VLGLLPSFALFGMLEPAAAHAVLADSVAATETYVGVLASPW